MLGILLVGMLVIAAAFMPLLLTDVPVAFVLLAATIVATTWGVFIWVWSTHRREVRVDRDGIGRLGS